MHPLLIAHRGASEAAPENTMAAFRQGWLEGADGMECDVRLSKDGEIVCIHDESTERTTETTLRVADANWEELKDLDAGSWKDSSFAGEPLPLLKQVLDELPNDKKIFIEVKCGPEIMPALDALLAGSEVNCDQVTIISFSDEVITAARKAMPHIDACWITKFKRSPSGLRWKPSLYRILKTLRASGASGLDCQAHKSIDKSWVRGLRRKGFQWHVWTINDVALARRFADLGVESITTNRPGALRQALEGSAS